MAGALVVFLASLVSVGASMFGYPVPGLALAVSSMFALLMCGMILWQTSEIIHGGEANYILVRFPLQSAHPFRRKLPTDSNRKLPTFLGWLESVGRLDWNAKLTLGNPY